MMLLIRRANQKGTIVVKTQLIPKKNHQRFKPIFKIFNNDIF